MTDPVTSTSQQATDESPLPGLAQLFAEWLTHAYVVEDQYLRSIATPVGDHILVELTRVFHPENKLWVRLRLELGDPPDPLKDGGADV